MSEPQEAPAAETREEVRAEAREEGIDEDPEAQSAAANGKKPGKNGNAVEKALTQGLSALYDRVAVRKETVLAAAKEHGLTFESWEQYQRRAPFRVMDAIADDHVRRCRLTTSGLGAAAGFGGLFAVVPDALQFVALTLRMVTGVAAAYGFDPSPQALDGRVKVIVLQAYLNANLGGAASKAKEAVTLATAAKLCETVATRATWLMRLIVLIARLLGLRLTETGIVRSIPLVSSGVNATFNWFLARKIADISRAELKQFRDDLRLGKYRGDPAYEGLGN